MSKRKILCLLITIIVSLLISLIFGKIYFRKRITETVVGANGDLAIMVYEASVGDYVKDENIPLGIDYVLNEKKSRCIGDNTRIYYDPYEGMVVFDTLGANQCYLYFDLTAASYIKSLYKEQGTPVGDGVLYLHDGSLENGANDNSLRYASYNPANYVCFDGDDCTNYDNLYRILGVFYDVFEEGFLKLVKFSATGTMSWDTTGYNEWSTSSLYNYLNNDWVNENQHIEKYFTNGKWAIGGVIDEDAIWTNSGTGEQYVTDFWTAENENSTDPAIGLISVSDFVYASDASFWNENLLYGEPFNNQWITYGLLDYRSMWTLTAYSYRASIKYYKYDSAFLIRDNKISARNVDYEAEKEGAVVPALYIRPDTIITGGDGTRANPYILSLPTLE